MERTLQIESTDLLLLTNVSDQMCAHLNKKFREINSLRLSYFWGNCSEKWRRMRREIRNPAALEAGNNCFFGHMKVNLHMLLKHIFRSNYFDGLLLPSGGGRKSIQFIISSTDGCNF